MQSARARDQLPPTMDHKGTVEISSEYHAAGGMGIGQPAVTLPTRGTFLFKAEEVDLEFFLDSVDKPSAPPNKRSATSVYKSSDHQQTLDYSRLYLPIIQTLVTARLNLLRLAAHPTPSGRHSKVTRMLDHYRIVRGRG